MATTRQPFNSPPGQFDAAPRIPLLALHGFTGSGADFRWLAAQTADLFDWHAPDLPGHGTNADAPPTAHTPAAVVRAIDQLLANLSATDSAKYNFIPTGGGAVLHEPPPPSHGGIDMPGAQSSTDLHEHLPSSHGGIGVPGAQGDAAPRERPPLPLLLGYSMGGRMALRYLAQYGTTQVRGVILIGAGGGLADAAERRARRHADHALAQRIQTKGIGAFMQYWNSLPLIASQSRSPCFEQLQQMRRTNSTTGLARSLRGIGTGAVAPVHNRLSHINIPCLLLTGAEDTKFTTLAAQLAAGLPTARHIIIPNAGHSPHWENPQATAEAIRTFGS